MQSFRLANKTSPQCEPKHRVLFFLRSWALVFLVSLFAVSAVFAADEARRLVAVLDYLGSDYKNAVQDGKVVSQDEYQEMQEFARRTQELVNQLKESDQGDKASVEPTLKSLANQIENKADAKTIAELANSAKDKTHLDLQDCSLSKNTAVVVKRQANL